MKLVRLMLEAYGPFTGTRLDFASTGANLHLIYGPNEAGKSSALRAMIDLRFGVPERSTDNFLHASKDLRIAGVFVDESGQELGLMRRKGRGQTLVEFDPTLSPTATGAAPRPGLERALCGGLTRAEFETLFGLDHERLRRGGKDLVQGEGELGAALFEASAGVQGIAALLATLDDDAKRYFNPHARSQLPLINAARLAYDEQRKALKEAQTRPADWLKLHRAHEQARARLDELAAALEALRRRDKELQELRMVGPLFHKADQRRAELVALAAIPDLPEQSGEERRRVMQQLAQAAEDADVASQQLAAGALARDALSSEPAVLAHAEAIERLASQSGPAARARSSLAEQAVRLRAAETALAEHASRCAPGRTPAELLAAQPDSADRLALTRHLDQLVALESRLAAQHAEAARLARQLAGDEEGVAAAVDPVALDRLQATLKRAQAEGDVAGRLAEAAHEIAAGERRLAQDLADLAVDTPDALRRIRPLLEAEIREARDLQLETRAAMQALRSTQAIVLRDREAQELRRRQLAATGAVVTADTLAAARSRRDEGWALVRSAYVERTISPEAAAARFDAERPLADAFESAQVMADHQGDLLRADANRAAILEDVLTRIEQMTAAAAAHEAELAALALRERESHAAWQARLAASGLPSLAIDLLGEWQLRREQVLELDLRLQGLRENEARCRRIGVELVAALGDALAALGEERAVLAADAEALPRLIERADYLLRIATADTAARAARAREAGARRARLAEIATERAETEASLAPHRAALGTWMARLHLAPDAVPDVIRARLQELDSLARDAAEIAEGRRRLGVEQALLDVFERQAAALAALLGEAAPIEAEDFAARARQRLEHARAAEQQRRSLERDAAHATAQRDRAAAAHTRLEAECQALCARAGVATAAELTAVEEAAAAKRSARLALAELERQIAEAALRPLDGVRAQLTELDGAALDSARERCAAELTVAEHAQQEAQRTEEAARHALAAIDESDRAAAAREAMESAAARLRGALRPWARLRLGHALLRAALQRFRERAQAPMVAAASRYFALITGGEYARLVTDEEGARPVLLAARAEGRELGVEALSEGTADQLYLALRLAALELRRAAHPHMPLVLDDVLVTSDDLRAGNMLRALAAFAGAGQVMVFTHHQHLIEIARLAVPPGALAIHQL